jgi:photosystem II stability/assembly factor-like uncharacterized protein
MSFGDGFRPRPTRVLGLLALALAIAGGVVWLGLAHSGSSERVGRLVHACPNGQVREADAGEDNGDKAGESGDKDRKSKTGDRDADADGKADPDAKNANGAIAKGCEARFHPESYGDLSRANSSLVSQGTDPFKTVRAGAYQHALTQRAALSNAAPDVAGTDGSWTPYGTGADAADNTDFDQSNGSTEEGLGAVSGRISDYAYDASTGSLYAAASNGGIWKTTDMGQHWTSVGDNLPTQVVSAVAFSPAQGGTLLVLTGDDAFGFDSIAGLGVYRSTDGGATWQKGTGVPDGANGFRIAVDPSDTSVAYAATGAGLYRTTDDGVSWTNVNLPTGDGVAGGQPDCTGNSSVADGCFLANQVTDVVVQGNPKSGITGTPGAVLAAVGWRAGTAQDADGTVQSPNNGIYVSDTGAPGTFTKTAPNVGGSDHGFSTQAETGRVALGIADGPDQDHKIVYALVEDAVKFNGGISGIDVEGPTAVPSPTVLKGVYVSTDFGHTWTEMEDSTTMSNDVTSGSALVGGVCTSQSYCPGVQAWYNEWVKPDPTTQDSSGVPTRVGLGLEEVWEGAGAPPTVPDTTQFHVIGRYFGGTTCAFLSTGLPDCPTNNPPQPSTTTHPDQHGSIFIPDGHGGVTLVVGNDGGAYSQHVASGDDFDNTHWGRGINTDLHTLQPYDAEMAKDGTVYAGLQDNGELKIQPDQQQFEIFGGDGFFTAVDPDNSNIAYEEYTSGAISVTKDGGKNWQSMDPQLTSPQFSNPFMMDPTDANHLITAGRDVEETTAGPDTVQCVDPSCSVINTQWTKVYDLGTQKHPGDASASSSDDDPDNQMSAIDLNGDNAYIGYCGFCDVITQGTPFANGIATNVGGAQPGKRLTGNGWHIAAAHGLPSRYISSVRMDSSDPRTVYVTVGGYGRKWAPPGAVKDDTSKVGTGHVFKSTDAGENFTDITGDLPDVPANWVIIRGGQLIVGTDIGVFASSDLSGTSWAVLGNGLPNVPITHLELKPGDPNTLVAATYGRGVYLYHFNTPPTAPTQPGAPVACRAGAGFAHFAAAAAKRGLRIRAVSRRHGSVVVNVYRYSVGNRVTGRKRLATFRNPKGAIALKPRGLKNGWYAVQATSHLAGTPAVVRSDTFHRINGRFKRRADFYGGAGCGDLRSFHLSSPVFGGGHNRSLAASYRVGRAGNVSVVLFRGRKVIKRFRTVHAKAGKTYHLRIASRHLKLGVYTVRVKLARTGGAVSRSLVSRRL